MKIILKFDDEQKVDIDALPSVVYWAQRNNDDEITKFETACGAYWIYKHLTKNGTKVVNIRADRREGKK